MRSTPAQKLPAGPWHVAKAGMAGESEAHLDLTARASEVLSASEAVELPGG